ncbi:MAG: 30S ribosomal protein S18 [Treponema sp.]|jgi:small subunit ribosomal protein S18|nr:30S ribosomal protein S18 [Treponema sp.]
MADVNKNEAVEEQKADINAADQTTTEDSGREDEGRGRNGKGKAFFHKKVCRFCANKAKIDYKDADGLRRFTTERGKILPRRITGTCSRHQKELANAIKRARAICLLPYVAD